MHISEKLKDGRRTIFSKFVIQLLFIMFSVEFVKGALLIAFLPVYMKNSLGATGFVIGWTLAAQYIGDNLLRTPIGWMIDRIGYRVSMLLGVIATFFAIGIIALTAHYYWIIAACALLGIGSAPLWPCVVTGTTEIAGDKLRGTIMSVVYIAWLSGVGLGPFVITYFTGAAAYGPAFRLLIGIMAAVVVVALFLPGKLAGNSKADSGNGEKGSKRHMRRYAGATGGKSRLQRIKAYLAEVSGSITVSPLLFPAMFAQTFALGVLTPILTLYVTDVLGLSGGQFRTFLLTGGAVTVGLMISVGKWVDRRGTKWFLNTGFLLSSVILAGFPFVRSLPVLYALVALLGAGYAMIIPAWNALIASAIPHAKRGAVWGFFLTIEGLGTTIGPIVSGEMWDVLGPQAPFLTSGSVLFLLFILQRFITAGKKSSRV